MLHGFFKAVTLAVGDEVEEGRLDTESGEFTGSDAGDWRNGVGAAGFGAVDRLAVDRHDLVLVCESEGWAGGLEDALGWRIVDRDGNLSAVAKILGLAGARFGREEELQLVID